MTARTAGIAKARSRLIRRAARLGRLRRAARACATGGAAAARTARETDARLRGVVAAAATTATALRGRDDIDIALLDGRVLSAGTLGRAAGGTRATRTDGDRIVALEDNVRNLDKAARAAARAAARGINRNMAAAAAAADREDARRGLTGLELNGARRRRIGEGDENLVALFLDLATRDSDVVGDLVGVKKGTGKREEGEGEKEKKGRGERPLDRCNSSRLREILE